MEKPIVPAPEKVTIEKLVYGGEGLSRADGRVSLTPFVLPGEEVVIEPLDKLRARLLRVEQTSPHRIAPGCPYFERCGGCHYQHFAYAHQLEQKLIILREVLQRVGKISLEDIPVKSGPEWEYRNRVQLHFENGNMGFYERDSHQLCPIAKCPISSPKINETIAALDRMVRDSRFPAFLTSLEIFTNETDVQLNVVESQRPVAKRFFDWCSEEIPGLVHGAISYTVGEDTFRVGPGSFFQVNRFLTDTLVQEGLGDASGEAALDLYAGVGLFSVPMARRFRRVRSIEAGGNAASDLQFNSEQSGLNIKAIKLPVEEYLAGLDTGPGFIVADPPRAGLGKAIVKKLLSLRPARLHIVSCDPATLARDLALLFAGGYKLEQISMVDLFPQTYHLETVARLTAS